MSGSADVAESLRRALQRHFAEPLAVDQAERLSGGASRETWSFDAIRSDGSRLPLILRRDPDGKPKESLFPGLESIGISRDQEWRLLQAVGQAGAPVPKVYFALEETEGGGFVMDRVAGETNPRRILREPEYAAAREKLAAQCGEAAARIHATDVTRLPPLQTYGAAEQVSLYRQIFERFGELLPTFDLTVRWLERHLPAPVEPTLVHGDFRHGNIIVDRDGLAAVLDWELPHLGDPMEDLGWICVKSWRFGGRLPVGGFGRREQMFAAYEKASGRQVDAARVHFWELFGTMKWGCMCLMLGFTHLLGQSRSVELAAIGRRVSETEYDLLNLLEQDVFRPNRPES